MMAPWNSFGDEFRVALKLRLQVSRPAAWIAAASLGVAALGSLAMFAVAYPRVAASSDAPGLQQRFHLVRLQPGQVVKPRILASLFPPSLSRAGRFYTPGLPEASTTARQLAAPGWLLYSNNPEVVSEHDLRLSDPAILCREELPAGAGRIFASHINPTANERTLLVEIPQSIHPARHACR